MCATSQRRRHSRWRMLFLLICILGYVRHSESAPPIPGRNIESRVAPGVPSSGSTVARKLEEVGLPSELAWQAWLLFDPHSGTHSDLDSSSLLRRIIPKSVFIAPPRASCPDGFQSNPGGGCTKKTVDIDHRAQAGFLAERLNAMFRKQAVKLPAINGPSQKLSSGPLQLNIPLTSSFDTHSTRVKHDQSIEQEQNKFQTDLMNPISFPIPFPQRSPAESNKRKVEEMKLSIKDDEDNLDDKEMVLSVRNHSSSSKNKNDGSPMNLVIAIDENNAGSLESSKEESDHDDIDSLELPSDSSEHFTDKRKQDKMATKNYNKYEVKNDTNSEEDEEEEELKSSSKNSTTSSRDSSREQEDFGEVISDQWTRSSAARTEPTVTELNWSDESTTGFPDSTELDQEQTEESTELLITVTTPRDFERSNERKDSEDTDELKNETDLEEVETKFSVVNNSHSRNSISQKRLDRNTGSRDELDEETTTSLSESTRTDQTEQTTDISTTPLPGTMNFLFNRYSQEEVTTENYPSSDPDFEEDESADSSVESDLDSGDEQRDEQSGNQESKDETYSQPQVGMRVLEFTENSNNTNLSGIVDYKT